MLAAAVFSLLRAGAVERPVAEALAVALLAGAALAAAGALAARPLLRLAGAARRIRESDLETPVPRSGPVEVRRLAEAMDEMRLSLRETHEDLLRLNRGLTQRAETSTAGVAAATQEFAVLSSIVSRLTGGRSDGMSGLADELTRLDWVEGAFIALADGEGRLVAAGQSKLGPGAVEGTLATVQEAFPPEALARGIFVEDAALRHSTRPLVAHGVAAMAVVPLDTPEGVAGVIGCVRHGPAALPESQRSLLWTVANQVALTLERSELADEAEESRRLAESVLREMSDGVIVLDAEERCRICNPAAAAMLDVDRAAILGQSAASWLPLPASILQALRARVEHPDAAATPLLSESGGRQLALSAGPFIDPDPANRGMILLIRDLSGEAEAERIKRDFVSMVGHELRTPLTTIRTSIDLMGEAEAGALSETQRHIVDILRTNSDRLLQLINDLLDMSALDSGRVEVQQATIDLSELVREAVDSEQGAALEESIALRVEAPADGGVAVWATGRACGRCS